MEQEYLPLGRSEDEDLLQLPGDLQERLTLTQKLRVRVISKMTKGGTAVPSTDEELKMFLAVMKDMDGVTLGEMKVKVEASTRGSDEIVKAAILEMNRLRGGITNHQPPPVIKRDIPSTPELEKSVDLVPDETLIGQQALSYEDFQARFGKV